MSELFISVLELMLMNSVSIFPDKSNLCLYALFLPRQKTKNMSCLLLASELCFSLVVGFPLV